MRNKAVPANRVILSKTQSMKTHKELVDGIEAMLIDPKIDADSMSMYFLKPTGNIVDDFFYFTHAQGGGLSGNLSDPYIKGHETDIKYWPNDGKKKVPFSDGHYYHTSTDITWQTAVTINPKVTPAEFYAMAKPLRDSIIDYFIKAGNKTTDPAVNILFSYCYWRSYHYEYNIYKDWYKTDINKDIKALGSYAVFTRVADIMIYENSQLGAVNQNPGWIKGLCCIWKLFRTYCKDFK